MPKQTDINAVIDDPTKQLTEADVDPLASAAKKSSWVDQGGPAERRLGTGGRVDSRMDAKEADQRLRQEALAHANALGLAQGYSDDQILATAKAYYGFLTGSDA